MTFFLFTRIQNGFKKKIMNEIKKKDQGQKKIGKKGS
jgi:hypothetical protein